MSTIIDPETIQQKIFLIRGQKVMIDRDLAEMYAVETKYLNRQVKRNLKRFPPEFMFQLNKTERDELVTICHRFKNMKHSSVLPQAFTEHGVAMLSAVLRGDLAVAISIAIVKAFIGLRQMVISHKLLAQKLKILELRVGKNDEDIKVILDAIRKLMAPPPEKPKPGIGFHVR